MRYFYLPTLSSGVFHYLLLLCAFALLCLCAYLSSYDKWSNKVQKTIGYQVIRSSDSIAANIAEGYGRYTPSDRKKFYLYSRGSFEETKTWLRKLIRRKVLSESSVAKYKIIIEKLGPKLNAFINSTKA